MLLAPGFHHLLLNSVGPWYRRQGDQPLVSTRGHLYDHIGLSITDLDAWIAKLREDGVRVPAEPYRLGDTRAVMIEGPSREALELVAVGGSA
jgi:hypothetical protein